MDDGTSHNLLALPCFDWKTLSRSPLASLSVPPPAQFRQIFLRDDANTCLARKRVGGYRAAISWGWRRLASKTVFLKERCEQTVASGGG
jgi:hypothetical protein